MSDKHIEEAVEWVGQTKLQTPPLTSNIFQALSQALEHIEVNYLVSLLNSRLVLYDRHCMLTCKLTQ